MNSVDAIPLYADINAAQNTVKSYICIPWPRRRWESNIKLELQEVGEEAWIGLIWLRAGTGGGRL